MAAKLSATNGHRSIREQNQIIESGPLVRTGLKRRYDGKDTREKMIIKERGGRYGASTKQRTGDTYARKESSPFVTDIELFRSIQEEVGLCAICETRRDLLNASLQDFRVKHGAIRPGKASLVWRSVERASADLTRVASVLSRLITAMGVISGVFRHRTDPKGTGKRMGAQFQKGALLFVRLGRD